MVWDSTPWLVGGGAEHSPEVARLILYAAANGAGGIVLPADLKVNALGVPAGQVTVGAGAALLLNPGGTHQTYAGRNPTLDYVDIPAQGAAGPRRDLIVARVMDPQYNGPVPPDPRNFQYMQSFRVPNVPAGTDNASDLNLGFPAVALARLEIPANTAVITNSMIVDVRQVAVPREHRVVQSYNINGSYVAPGAVFADWPGWEPVVRVPAWATHMNVQATLGSVLAPAGDSTGEFRVLYGTAASRVAPYDFSNPASGAASTTRETLMTVFDFDVRAQQGNLLILRMQARSTSTPRLTTRPNSFVIYDTQFFEQAI